MQFIDLGAQRARIGAGIDDAIAAVVAHGDFILGPEVADFERALGGYVGAEHVVSCANGTDALVLALRAFGLGAGQKVIVPSFTFAATAEAVVLAGGVPVFADVERSTFNLGPTEVEAAFAAHPDAAGVVAVDLFGLPADYAGLREVLPPGAFLLADAAQSMGAERDGSKAGSLAEVTTTSFFPAKPLGCYGDGGAVLTQRREVADVVRSLRVHGKGEHKYDNERIGTNSRLDSIQAAVLLPKLGILEEEMRSRQEVAARYAVGLGSVLEVPQVPDGVRSAWAQYTIVHPDRDAIVEQLRAEGIPSAIYYPRPLHLQTAYRDFPTVADLTVAETLSTSVVSLPMHPYLSHDEQDRVVAAVRAAVTGGAGR